MPMGTLLSEVALECTNQVTHDIILQHSLRFTDMIGELHSNRTEAELRDPSVKDSLKKQAVQQANQILIDLQGQEVPENRVINLYYAKYYISTI